MWVITFTRERHLCEVCSRRGTLRWTNGKFSAWRCVRHSIRLLAIGV
jgi:hypothetical protein